MNLPKPYISWSQLELWERSKNEYVKKYIHGNETFETSHLRLGKKFASELQLEISNDPATQMMIDTIPKLEESEVEFEAMFGKYKLFGKFDSAGVTGFYEYKTGTVPWTQERVNEHGQLDFYAFARMLLGLKNNDVKLVWLPTKNGKITGLMHQFTRRITDENIEAMKKRIEKYVNEVEHYKILKLD